MTDGETRCPPRLSICIATLNRAGYIGETLASIGSQLRPDVEVVIVDGASVDNTRDVVAPYVARYANIHYYRETTNSGVDADFDKAVGYATGDYCWLLPDDDVLTPRAVGRVIATAQQERELIVVNSEIWNSDLTQSLHTKMLSLSEDCLYGPGDEERAFIDLATCLSYIGSVVIRRRCWVSRERSAYHGTVFAHVGVIFQLPALSNIAVIAEPLILNRYGNGQWTPRSFEIWYFKWPDLIWSFSHFSTTARGRVVPREPWRYPRRLFKSRAMGDYSREQFTRLLAGRAPRGIAALALAISVFPAKIANTMWVLYYSLVSRSARYTLFDLLRSRHSSFVSRAIARALRIKVV